MTVVTKQMTTDVVVNLSENRVDCSLTKLNIKAQITKQNNFDSDWSIMSYGIEKCEIVGSNIVLTIKVVLNRKGGE